MNLLDWSAISRRSSLALFATCALFYKPYSKTAEPELKRSSSFAIMVKSESRARTEAILVICYHGQVGKASVN